jgi:hypothetical protein
VPEQAILEPKPQAKAFAAVPPPKVPNRKVVTAAPAPVAVIATADDASVPEPVAAAAPAPAPAAGRPMLKFFHGAVQKDELKSGRKDWARYISPSTHSRLRDVNDASVIYPSLEAAFAATMYQLGTDKPELGATLFNVNSTIHQNCVKALALEPGATDKRKTEILEEELAAIRSQMKPAEIKRTGAKFN